ncbi:hypothetical protein ACLOJK_009606 [Asimina triloba]
MIGAVAQPTISSGRHPALSLPHDPSPALVHPPLDPEQQHGPPSTTVDCRPFQDPDDPMAASPLRPAPHAVQQHDAHAPSTPTVRPGQHPSAPASDA